MVHINVNMDVRKITQRLPATQAFSREVVLVLLNQLERMDTRAPYLRSLGIVYASITPQMGQAKMRVNLFGGGLFP